MALLNHLKVEEAIELEPSHKNEIVEFPKEDEIHEYEGLPVNKGAEEEVGFKKRIAKLEEEGKSFKLKTSAMFSIHPSLRKIWQDIDVTDEMQLREVIDEVLGNTAIPMRLTSTNSEIDFEPENGTTIFFTEWEAYMSEQYVRSNMLPNYQKAHRITRDLNARLKSDSETRRLYGTIINEDEIEFKIVLRSLYKKGDAFQVALKQLKLCYLLNSSFTHNLKQLEITKNNLQSLPDEKCEVEVLTYHVLLLKIDDLQQSINYLLKAFEEY